MQRAQLIDLELQASRRTRHNSLLAVHSESTFLPSSLGIRASHRLLLALLGRKSSFLQRNLRLRLHVLQRLGRTSLHFTQCLLRRRLEFLSFFPRERVALLHPAPPGRRLLRRASLLSIGYGLAPFLRNFRLGIGYRRSRTGVRGLLRLVKFLVKGVLHS